MDSRLMKATTIKAAKDTADGVRQLHERMTALEGKLDELLAALRAPAAAPEPTHEASREGRRR
jgi:hypothetical protein